MTTFAEIGILVILFVFLLIHLAVLFKLLPHTIVWGSRLKTDKEMYRFETISILLIIFFLWVTFEKMYLVTGFLSNKALDIIFWLMTGLFALNSIGNLLSGNRTERLLFTLAALILAIFCFIVAWK